MLLLIPNISEGRDRETVDAVGRAYVSAGARLLDTHVDADHNRSVHTLAVVEHALVPKVLLAGAAEAVARIDITANDGLHPHVGALDVAPVVHLDAATRGSACAAALAAAHVIGTQAQIPVFLYGLLAGGRTRHALRSGGPANLQRRIDARELAPDFGPRALHATAGATLVAARPPLVAFNLELAPGTTLAQAKDIAANVREGGPRGLKGVRALGLELTRDDGLQLVQVTTNVEDHLATPLAALVEAVSTQADVVGAELVGLAPEAAFAGFPDALPVRNRRTVEEVLRSGPSLSS